MAIENSVSNDFYLGLSIVLKFFACILPSVIKVTFKHADLRMSSFATIIINKF